ncbi:MAG: hypothetical protein IAF02_27830 [Anaerolineae bacterium]|nr:hypothetical protein [Anaerolineae bacterium]
MDDQESTTEVNIEEIMQQIRGQILARKTAVSGQDTPVINTEGKRFPPEFYEHLYQAAMIHNQIGIEIHVTKVNIPVIGSMLEKIRMKLHELVVFYVNKSAAQQIQFNTHILQAVSLIAQEIETEN